MRFTISGGSIADTIVHTDDNGRASCGRWTIGLIPGDNLLVATAENVDTPVYFHAYGRAVLGVVRERYKLSSVGGAPLPVGYSGGGQSWEVVGGEYLLADNGTFAWGYDILSAGTTRSNRITGVYTRSDSTIRFDVDGRSFSTGTVQGDALQVEYYDYVDFDPEVYTRLPAPPSARSSPPTNVRARARQSYSGRLASPPGARSSGAVR